MAQSTYTDDVSDDRVKVAGVRMSREEASRVRARHGEMFQWQPGSMPLLLRIVLEVVLLFVLLRAVGLATRGTDWVSQGLRLRVLLALYAAAFIGVPLIEYLRYRRVVRKQYWCAMSDLGMRLCIGCGYEIGDVGAIRCPECGAPFKEPANHA